MRSGAVSAEAIGEEDESARPRQVGWHTSASMQRENNEPPSGVLGSEVPTGHQQDAIRKPATNGAGCADSVGEEDESVRLRQVGGHVSASLQQDGEGPHIGGLSSMTPLGSRREPFKKPMTDGVDSADSVGEVEEAVRPRQVNRDESARLQQVGEDELARFQQESEALISGGLSSRMPSGNRREALKNPMRSSAERVDIVGEGDEFARPRSAAGTSQSVSSMFEGRPQKPRHERRP